MVTNFLENGAN